MKIKKFNDWKYHIIIVKLKALFGLRDFHKTVVKLGKFFLSRNWFFSEWKREFFDFARCDEIGSILNFILNFYLRCRMSYLVIQKNSFFFFQYFTFFYLNVSNFCTNLSHHEKNNDAIAAQFTWEISLSFRFSCINSSKAKKVMSTQVRTFTIGCHAII